MPKVYVLEDGSVELYGRKISISIHNAYHLMRIGQIRLIYKLSL